MDSPVLAVASSIAPPAALVTLALVAVVGYVLSGSGRIGTEDRLEALQRLEDLGHPQVTFTAASRAMARRLLPGAGEGATRRLGRSSDQEWVRGLQQQHQHRIAERGGVAAHRARVAHDEDLLAAAVASAAGSAELSSRLLSERVERLEHARDPRIAEADTVAELRERLRPVWRRQARAFGEFVRTGAAWNLGTRLFVQVLDYIGRGSGLGFFAGALIASGASITRTDLLENVAVGSVILGGLALVLWQTRMARIILGQYLEHGSLEPRRERQLHWCRRLAFLILLGLYALLASGDLILAPVGELLSRLG